MLITSSSGGGGGGGGSNAGGGGGGGGLSAVNVIKTGTIPESQQDPRIIYSNNWCWWCWMEPSSSGMMEQEW